MRILIDIGHPAHVHYFKNFIKIMSDKGHLFCITSRNKEFAFKLLNNLNLKFYDRGKGRKKILGKIMYIPYADFFIYKIARKFKPDIFLSFGSTYASHAAFLYNKPHIAFDDTEHAKFELMMYPPFTKAILTPGCFLKDLGKKHIRFNGYMELCYLHPKYFVPNKDIKRLLHINENGKYVIVRFVSWNASHDIGQTGLSLDLKYELIKLLCQTYKVFISSEEVLPGDLKEYQYPLPPETMHDALAFADLFIGEGVTMASECAVLGTPAIYINSLALSYATEQEEIYGLVYNFRKSDGVLNKVKSLISDPLLKAHHLENRKKLITDKINTTDFMVWFIENYPNSFEIMKRDPDYQYRFK